MKKLMIPIAVLLAAVSCHDRSPVVRDTIPYVKQIAVDTVGTFSLVKQYRTAGTKGTIALIGEPDECLLLSRAFMTADFVDNIDGKAVPDRLPDFSGEAFEVVLDNFNAPYLRLASSSPDSLREAAVRNAVMVLDTVAYSNPYDKSSRLRKGNAKVFVLASSLLSEFGRFDIDTLFKMGGREALILSPDEALVDVASRTGVKHAAAWAPAESRDAYLSAAEGIDLTVISPSGGDVRTAFRELLRQYRRQKPNTVLDAVLLDSFTVSLEDLQAEVEHIHRQITEEDMAFDRILAPRFRFLEPKACLTDACYRLLREKNLFTHNIAYPSVRYFQTEEGMDGNSLLVEISADYLAGRFGDASDQADQEESYVYVPDHD